MGNSEEHVETAERITQTPAQEREVRADRTYGEKHSSDEAGVAEQHPANVRVQRTDSNDDALVNRLVENDTRYSIFSPSQKRWIVFAAAMASFFSPLSSSIYFPSITTIARDLGVGTSQINLTVTLYLVMQGVSSLLVAPFSDNLGRRPAYIISFIVFVAANLGLGLQTSFVALLLLRMLQSLGASGTISLAQGVTGDVVTTAERGSYIAIVSIPQVAAPVIAPILGGLLGQYLGWHSVFWFLLIASGVLALALGAFLPETCRKVVGDGSLPKPMMNMSAWDALKTVRRRAYDPQNRMPLHGECRLSDINPLSPLKAFGDIESLIVLIASALILACMYAMGTVFSDIFGRLYGFNTLQVSLMFVPLGVGAIVSSYTTGQLIDWNYRRHARKHNMPLTRNRQYDLSNFNIERTRLEIALPLMILTVISTIAFGWVTKRKVNLAGPVMVISVAGYGYSAAFQTLNVLMIDVYPSKPATITAAGNLARSEFGAAASAAIAPMIQAMGEGWAFTVVACICLAYTPLLVLVMIRGIKWRQAKQQRSNRG